MGSLPLAAALLHRAPALQRLRVAAVECFDELLAALQLFGVTLCRIEDALLLFGGGFVGGARAWGLRGGWRHGCVCGSAPGRLADAPRRAMRASPCCAG